MHLYRSAIIESDGKPFVEMDLADDPESPEGQTLHFRLLSRQGGYPRIPEAQLIALRRARNVIDVEIQRLERIRDQEHPDEDWVS